MSHIPSVPELEVKAVQIAVFILLLIALAGLIIEAGFWLERKWIDERARIHANAIMGSRAFYVAPKRQT